MLQGWVARDSKKRSAVGRSVIASDHRAGYDDKHEDQRRAGAKSFSNDPSMRNIATGVHAHPIINVDTARSVGAAILKSMEGKTSDEHSFIRKDQVVTLGTKSSVKIDGVEAPVDP